MDQPKIVPFERPKKPPLPTSEPAVADTRGYRLYPMNDGDFLMSRSLLDLLLLHLTEDATPEQRRALAHEVMVLAGLA